MLSTALKFEQVFSDGPALILLTQKIADGHPHIFKEHLTLLDLPVEAREWRYGNPGGRHIDQ